MKWKKDYYGDIEEDLSTKSVIIFLVIMVSIVIIPIFLLFNP
jgi:hypothetical protein